MANDKKEIAAFEAALMRLVDKSPATALSLLTGAFVSLTLGLMRTQGHDDNQEIKIDGGENRDITIHKAKVRNGE